MVEPHILFAEDDSDTREMVQLLLNIAGFRVSVVEESQKVLELIKTQHFDVLLLDSWMPDMTGLELCYAVRAVNQNVPIVFCSGAASKADIEAAITAGAHGYIIKPFNPDTLIQTSSVVAKCRILNSRNVQ